MFKKMLPWLIIVFIAITLIAIGAFVLWDFIMKEPSSQDPSAKAQEIADQVETKRLSAKERAELTYDVLDVTTNLSNINYIVKISFSFVVENKATREEIEMINPLLLDIIGNILSDTTPEEIGGSAGKDVLKSKLINSINPILNEGNLREINISNFIITQR
jgi:flagellar FliL protein